MKIAFVVRDVRPAGRLAIGDEAVAVATVVLEPLNDPEPGTDRDKLWHPAARVSGELRFSAILEEAAASFGIGTVHEITLEPK